MNRYRVGVSAILAVLLFAAGLRAEDDLRATVEALKREVESLRTVHSDYDSVKRELEAIKSSGGPSTITIAETALDSKYGPEAAVKTKTGKLTVGGLIQVWYYGIQNDSRGFFHDSAVNNIPDTNKTQDNDGFRVRRTHLKLRMDLNDYVSSQMLLDPVRESLGFPSFPSNQGNTKKANVVSPEFLAAFKPNGVNNTAPVAQVQSGGSSTTVPRMLLDAYLNVHSFVPYHDFQFGQFKPSFGEEGLRPDAELDFIERSMVGFQSDTRDIGASIHGSFFGEDCRDRDGRVQYWLGVFNGAGTFFDPGNQQSRPDNNDHKDINARVLFRPLWDDCRGHLEFGASFIGGNHGESGPTDTIKNPINGVERPQHWAAKYGAWGHYRFGSILSGLWLRTEWLWMLDREAPGTVLDALGNGTGNANGYAQTSAQSFSRQGIYGAIAYNLGESKICGIPKWMKSMEFLGRFDEYQNISLANEVNPQKTDRLYTRAWTAGVNYYVSGHNTKIQANYNWVELPANKSDANRVFHNVRNDSFMLNFQVMF